MARDLAVRKPLEANPNIWLVAALSAATMVLVSAAIIGARNADSSAPTSAAENPAQGYEAPTEQTQAPIGDPGAAAPAAAPTTPGAAAAPKPGTAKAPAKAPPSQPLASQPGATREGVFTDFIKVGVHVPATFDGAPLALADDPITGFKGFITYINSKGGVNGRKIRAIIVDDRYTTQGGQQAAEKLARQEKPFIIEGTLGIDQIEKVAREAKSKAIPYLAGGGPEPEFKDVGMYQVLANYDQWGHYMADFICKYGKQYVGENEIRIGTTSLNSEWILPMEKRFVSELESRGCIVPADANARGTIIKPTEQTTYGDQILKLRNSYGNKGANLIVPLQDPISTGRQVAEMKPYKATWSPKWTFGNFAHDGNTALSLMGGEWNPPVSTVRGLSGACYYLSPNAYNTFLCAKMKDAHEQWVSLGNVTFDENAGGSGGNGRANYNFTEASWKTDGSGGAAGYQFTYSFHGALNAMGADPTREKFIAALNAYDNYSNLITGPITFKNTPNKMIGAKHFTVIEGAPSCTSGEGDQFCYRQVTDISPGLIDHF